MRQPYQTTRRSFVPEYRAVRPPQMTRQQRLRKIRKSLFEKDNRCFYCRTWIQDFGESTLDHLHPVSKGGSDRVHNLVLACIPCNRAKGNFVTIDEARIYTQAKKEKRVRAAGWCRPRALLDDNTRNRVPAKRDTAGDQQLQREMGAGNLPEVPSKETEANSRKLKLTEVDISELKLLDGIAWYQHTIDELRALPRKKA